MWLTLGLVLFIATGRSGSAQSPPADLLPKLRQQIARFQEEAPSLVARERYSQSVTDSRGEARSRTLVSEFVMVRLPGTAGWVSFRDVLEVDGRQVNDRERRLIDLLQSPSPSALAQARKLAAESARFNLGQVSRTLNVPNLALEFLSARQADRVSITPADAAKLNGVQTFMFRFKEHTGPSIIRSPEGREVLVNGRVWVDPVSAALVRTEVIVRDRQSTGSCIVDFRMDDRLGLRVPAKMTERYGIPSETIDAVAEYSDYRRFAVSTDEKLIKPPGSD
jgi:hypothetical protein